MNENSKNSGDADSSNIKTKKVVAVLFGIGLVVLGFYLYKFHHGLSNDNGDWGTFGDYVGGILNPVIAGFAFYLIAKTYELQKTELEATRSLLEVSTKVQKEQIKLAALTALLNSNLTRIGLLKSEKAELLKTMPLLQQNRYKSSPIKPSVKQPSIDGELVEMTKSVLEKLEERDFEGSNDEKMQLREIDREINNLTKNNIELEKQIEAYLVRIN